MTQGSVLENNAGFTLQRVRGLLFQKYIFLFPGIFAFSLFQILWELLIVLHSKQDRGWGRESQLLFQSPDISPFSCQVASVHFTATVSQAGGYCCPHFSREANENLRLAHKNLTIAPSRSLTSLLKKPLQYPSSLAASAKPTSAPALAYFSPENLSPPGTLIHIYVNLFVVYPFYIFLACSMQIPFMHTVLQMEKLNE